ncbi:hypothetical protein IMZ08_17950 [Bacillus luteolus]|uniref:Uncharacterized protein n=1 Tax=Litchfieldia luteola TaxID=682179 RepID=A0ABR9QN46_9BACI|nr:hypothetical protein [Cytobacillus luteolus]MBE4909922.1 hypothetical protein [Cytobacillus luteolus]MBP1942522.1 ABC-type polysaccharide/polyol phosphate export permease [Cytobacillus luteolus]
MKIKELIKFIIGGFIVVITYWLLTGEPKWYSFLSAIALLFIIIFTIKLLRWNSKI